MRGEREMGGGDALKDGGWLKGKNRNKEEKKRVVISLEDEDRESLSLHQLAEYL